MSLSKVIQQRIVSGRLCIPSGLSPAAQARQDRGAEKGGRGIRSSQVAERRAVKSQGRSADPSRSFMEELSILIILATLIVIL